MSDKVSFPFVILLCLLLLQGCSSQGYSARSYQMISAELNKAYKLSRSDLIINYDLGKIGNTNCIYSPDLGIIINNKEYTQHYLRKFKAVYKSPTILRKEAQKKVVRIYKLLLGLHKKHRILSNNKYQYVKRLAKADLTKIDPRKELSKLDRILAFIPIMLPSHKCVISSHYGNRKHPTKKRKKFHCGIDLVAKESASVYAAANGRITFAGKKNGYGNTIEIEHSPNVRTIYAHLDSIFVSKGQGIARGVTIGQQGNTGIATKEHLHFEIRVKGKHINPYDFLSYSCR